jgi:putative peptidoglycan lipid II flippase
VKLFTSLLEHKLSVYLSLIAGFQILLSFGMQWYVVAYFGAGMQTDALYSGYTAPQVLTSLFIESLSVVMVPVLSTMTEDELQPVSWLLFVGAIGAFGCAALLFWLIAPLIVPLIVPGFSATGKQLTISLTRIQIIGLVGAACYALFSALYQVRNRFIWPPLSILIAAAVSWLLVIWQMPHYGIKSVAWSQVLFIWLPALLLLPALKKIRRPRWQAPVVKEAWRRVRPVILGKAFGMMAVPLDRFLASFLAPGSVVIFELVGRFYGAVIRVLSQGILTPFVPQLSRLAHRHSWHEFRAVYKKQSLLMLVPAGGVALAAASLAAIILKMIPSDPARHVAGSLTGESLSRMMVVTIAMAGVLPFTSIANSQINAYYAMGDTRTPTKIFLVIFMIGTVLKVFGFLMAGIKGMALAVTLCAGTYVLLLEYLLHKHYRLMQVLSSMQPQSPPSESKLSESEAPNATPSVVGTPPI